jgi:hypothetical protein
MSSVSCVAPRTCTAVGDNATHGTNLNVALPLAEHEWALARNLSTSWDVS